MTRPHMADPLQANLPLDVPLVPESVRDGSSTLERWALSHLETSLASIPARILLRLILWPETVQEFAAWAGVRPAQAYNTASKKNGRPYHVVRQHFARRLGLSKAAVDAVLDRPRLPLERHRNAREIFGAGTPGEEDPASHPPASALVYRDGMLEVEQLALRRAEENIAAFPPGTVLQLLIWPYSLRELAEALGTEDQDLYNMLAFQRGMRYRPLRDRLVRFLGTDVTALDHLIEVPAAEAVPFIQPRDSQSVSP